MIIYLYTVQPDETPMNLWKGLLSKSLVYIFIHFRKLLLETFLNSGSISMLFGGLPSRLFRDNLEL